jgi:ABC-2 type transport system permease protein
MTTLAEYRSSRELLQNLTLRELRSKYKRSVLGWTWSMLNPLATMVIFTVVFRYFLKIQAPRGVPSGIKSYALYLLCALLPWNFFQLGVTASMGSLVGNGNLIKKTYFPRELLPAASVASSLVSHLIEMGVLLIALVIFGNFRAILFTPVVLALILVLCCFSLGFGLLLSVLNVYYRDVQYLMGIVFMVWLYLTPIVYPESLVPKEAHIFGVLVPVRALLKLNPMTDFVASFRAAWYDGRMPPIAPVFYVIGVSVAVFLVGLFTFFRLEGRLAEEL